MFLSIFGDSYSRNLILIFVVHHAVLNAAMHISTHTTSVDWVADRVAHIENVVGLRTIVWLSCAVCLAFTDARKWIRGHHLQEHRNNLFRPGKQIAINSDDLCVRQTHKSTVNYHSIGHFLTDFARLAVWDNGIQICVAIVQHRFPYLSGTLWVGTAVGVGVNVGISLVLLSKEMATKHYQHILGGLAHVTCIRGGEHVTVPLKDVQVGDVVEIPEDGTSMWGGYPLTHGFYNPISATGEDRNMSLKPLPSRTTDVLNRGEWCMCFTNFSDKVSAGNINPQPGSSVSRIRMEPSSHIPCGSRFSQTTQIIVVPFWDPHSKTFHKSSVSEAYSKEMFNMMIKCVVFLTVVRSWLMLGDPDVRLAPWEIVISSVVAFNGLVPISISASLKVYNQFSPSVGDKVDVIISDKTGTFTKDHTHIDSIVTDGDSIVTDGDSIVTDGDSIVTDGDSIVTDGDSIVTDGGRTPRYGATMLENVMFALDLQTNEDGKIQTINHDDAALLDFISDPGHHERIKAFAYSPQTKTLRYTQYADGHNGTGSVKSAKILYRFPYEEKRARMSTIVEMCEDQSVWMFCKGSASSLGTSPVVEDGDDDGETTPTTATNISMNCDFSGVYERAEEETNKGSRLLFFTRVQVPPKYMKRLAGASSDEDLCAIMEEIETKEFVGRPAFFSSATQELQDGATEFVHGCHDRGVQFVLCTGDNRKTAHSVLAHQTGLYETHRDNLCTVVFTGDAVSACKSPEDFREKFKAMDRASFVVVAEAKPKDKQRLVEFIQQAHGKVVGAVGDGKNDEMMLRKANKGVGIGTGPDALTKNAADLSIECFNDMANVFWVQGFQRYYNERAVVHLLLFKGIMLALAPFFYGIQVGGFNTKFIPESANFATNNIVCTLVPLGFAFYNVAYDKDTILKKRIWSSSATTGSHWAYIVSSVVLSCWIVVMFPCMDKVMPLPDFPPPHGGGGADGPQRGVFLGVLASTLISFILAWAALRSITHPTRNATLCGIILGISLGHPFVMSNDLVGRLLMGGADPTVVGATQSITTTLGVTPLNMIAGIMFGCSHYGVRLLFSVVHTVCAWFKRIT
jgi:magnesium-transporting ATPase (P-type)